MDSYSKIQLTSSLRGIKAIYFEGVRASPFDASRIG